MNIFVAQAYKLYSSPALDFDLRFTTAALARLQALLAPRERAVFRMLWSPAAGDAWESYLAAYMAGVSRFCLRQGTGGVASPPQVINPIINPISDPEASGRRAGGRPASSAASSTGSACTDAADRGRVVDVVARA